jgi:hypothetical protein
LRFGIKQVEGSLRQIAAYALQQKLIPRMLTPEELFADARSILGMEAE